MPQDYILRLLQQLSQVVASILGRKAASDLAGAQREIEEQCLQHIGLPFVVVKQSTPEGLAALLAMGGARQVPRTLILAELLWHDGDLCERRGNPVAAAMSYQQAERLVGDALPSLAGEDAVVFRERHAQLAAKLRDLAGG